MVTRPAQDSRRSRLKRMVPCVGSFFTPLRLVDAFKEYDEFFALSRRRYVPPNFAELRHVLNIAQASACRAALSPVVLTYVTDSSQHMHGGLWHCCSR